MNNFAFIEGLKDAGFPAVALCESGELLANPASPQMVVTVDGQAYRVDFSEPVDEAAVTAFAASWSDPAVQDWRAFTDDLITIPGFFGAVAVSAMAPFITSRMAALGDGAEFQGAGDRLMLWNEAPPALDQSQRDELTALAATHSIPVTIDADNLLTAT